MLDVGARRRIVTAAWRLRGVPYDFSHGDDSWRNLRALPTSLDCSKFVCRVACEALSHDIGTFAANADWLLRHLAHVDAGRLTSGDVVGYYREAAPDESSEGPLVWHVMIVVGRHRITRRLTVVGACDLAGRVEECPIDYDERWGARRWRRIDRRIVPPNPYRRLELRVVHR